MKKNYIILFTAPVLLFTLLYFSTWGFIAGIGAIMIVVAYRYYALRVQALHERNEVLEKETEQLHVQLEHAVVKEQKSSREAEQTRRSRQDLLTVLSHEIRTPMNGVMGMALLLKDTPLSSEQQDYLQTIRHCGESLLTTINSILVSDMLNLSKLQQEATQLEYKEFDLRDSVEEVLEMLSDKAGKKGINLVYEIGANVPEQLIGDNKRLRQVLMNLVENGVNFTQQGEVFVGITNSTLTIAGSPPELHFEIRDTGIGIPKEQQKHLFMGIPGKGVSPQSDSTTSGLGLVICKKLVELMGGQIKVQSVPGQGSSFKFSIPVTPNLKTVRNHAQQNKMVNLEGKNILVVDDNQTSRNALINQLKSWKMLPVGVASANEALNILSVNPGFSLILTDINMPGMNGIEFTKSLKSQYPAIPVMGMFTTGEENYKQHSGLFISILNKPVRRHLLRDYLIGVLSPVDTGAQKNTGNPLSDNFADHYPLRILIAEDNNINQKLATRILNKLGYKPEIANHGKEVMEMVSQEHYDIILMDVQMPEMNGLEATRMIRTCLEVQPVIIAMTANVLQGDRDECIQAGMDDYMSKPIELKELLSQLEKWSLVIREKRK